MKKLLLAVVFVAIAALLYWQFGRYLNLQYIATQEAQLRDFQAKSPWLVYGSAFLLYAALTGLSLPGAAALTLLYGWYFGFLPGLILVSFGSTAGATIAFLLSRLLFRETIVQHFGDRLETFNRALATEGPFYLFTLRLIPAVPFFVINAVMGLTPIAVGTFWWVSQLGMLPGTAVYVYAGSSVPSLAKLAEQGVASVFTPAQLSQLVAAFAALGFFPIAVRTLMRNLKRPAAEETTAKLSHDNQGNTADSTIN